MLVIFDLDDTLVDTSGSLLPQLFLSTIEALKEGGVFLRDEKCAIEMLKRLNCAVLSSKESLEEFMEIHEVSKDLVPLALKTLYKSHTFSIHQTPGSIDLLLELKKRFELILVTIGEEAVQKKKLKKANIPPDLFKEIYICKEKKKVYLEILNKFPYPPEKIVVIGDRPVRDLRPAKELGFKTIHIKWGRGLNCQDVRGDVDYTIYKLSDCEYILRLIENFQESYDHIKPALSRNDNIS
ncbi:MAG: HAD family hydrolase [Simkaniaceae bacterium]